MRMLSPFFFFFFFFYIKRTIYKWNNVRLERWFVGKHCLPRFHPTHSLETDSVLIQFLAAKYEGSLPIAGFLVFLGGAGVL